VEDFRKNDNTYILSIGAHRFGNRDGNNAYGFNEKDCGEFIVLLSFYWETHQLEPSRSPCALDQRDLTDGKDKTKSQQTSIELFKGKHA